MMSSDHDMCCVLFNLNSPKELKDWLKRTELNIHSFELLSGPDYFEQYGNICYSSNNDVKNEVFFSFIASNKINAVEPIKQTNVLGLVGDDSNDTQQLFSHLLERFGGLRGVLVNGKIQYHSI